MRLIFSIGLLILLIKGVEGAVENSPHDLRPEGGIQSCIFCHIPYGPSQLKEKWVTTKEKDLWIEDRKTKRPQLRVARACLSCHDGNMAQDITANLPYVRSLMVKVKKYDRPSDSRFKVEGVSKFRFGERIIKVVDTDQVYDFQDHPIGIRMKDRALLNSGLYKEPLSQEVKLYRGLIDCGTCHSVHNTTIFQPLLSASNSGSQLCLSCHRK